MHTGHMCRQGDECQVWCWQKWTKLKEIYITFTSSTEWSLHDVQLLYHWTKQITAVIHSIKLVRNDQLIVVLTAAAVPALSFYPNMTTLRSGICRRNSVCRLSVTFVHPTQLVEIFGNASTTFCSLAIHWSPCKILRRSSQGNPSDGVKTQEG